MSDLLLEVGTEEIPARMVDGARRDLRSRFAKCLQDLGLTGTSRISVEATPRRLALFAEGILSRQEDRVQVFRGPTRKVAFDARGNPTLAAIGFAKRAGVPVSALQIGADDKLMSQRTMPGRDAAELLAKRLAGIVLGVRFPRSMHWAGRGSPRFIRPIRWIVALLDGEVVPFEIAGVRAGRTTWGHRRLGRGPVEVSEAASYRDALRSNAVILSSDQRARRIVDGASKILPAGSRLRSNPKLLSTLVNETEFPTPVLGRFDSAYLNLPEEVLETVMLVHQKYFVVERPDGRMTNRFVAVANSSGDPSGKIRTGHERVLRARFNDARFFWDFDQRHSLQERAEHLKDVTFQASLGSYWEKTESNLAAVRGLASALKLDDAERFAAERAALLAKCDLTTEMVGEFPELQGRIGGLYSTAQGEGNAVAEAIYDHYLPLGAADSIPRSTAGQVTAVADKLATLGGMFRLGLIPTGSKDPLALRRAAFGAMRIVLEGGLAISIDQLVSIAGAGSNAAKLRSFLVERLRHWLLDRGGIAADVVQAVTAASDQVPIDVLARSKALAEVRATPDFESLATSFKRIRNLLERAGGADSHARSDPDPSLFADAAESDLHEALQTVSERTAACNAVRDYGTSLLSIATLRPLLDRYFDEVLVMADDPQVRANRLAFLASVLAKLSTIADFAAIAPKPVRRRK